ncbi:MAG: hypothetical protein AAGC77_07495 [Pseudomonadota bacterium]
MAATKFRKPLPKRFSAAVSDEAYATLRELAERANLSNNYVLTTLLEYAEDLIDPDAFDRAVKEMLEKARVSP